MRTYHLFPIILLFVYCENQNIIQRNLIDFVPQHTVAIMQVDDFNMIKNALQNQVLLNQIVQKHPGLEATLSAITPEGMEGPALYCFSEKGKSEIAVSLIYHKKPDENQTPQNNRNRRYNGIEIGIVKKGESLFYQSELAGIQFITDTQLVLENSIRNLSTGKRGLSDPDFYSLGRSIDPNAPMHILLHKEWKKVFPELVPDTPLFPGVGNDWSVFDFNSKKDPFTLDGIAFINDSLPDRLALIQNTGNKTILTPKIVPQSFTAYLGLSIENGNVLENNFSKFSRFHNLALPSIDLEILNSVDEIAWFVESEHKAVAFHVNNANALEDFIGEKNDEQSILNSPYYKAALPKDVLQFLEIFGTKISPKWVFPWGEFLIYVEERDFIQTLIRQYKTEAVLQKDFHFNALQKSLADASAFLWIGHAEKLTHHWKKETTTESKGQKDSFDFRGYPLLAFQGVGDTQFFQFRLTAQADRPEQTKNTVVNQTTFTLDNTPVSEPQWLKNHRNKTMDIAVQDENNILYLFSNTGTLFWKKQLPGAIIGPIQQVDLYKNGRLQMAFRTQDRFLILDRNGKVVPPFDMKISGDLPLQPLAVFDYDRNRNYRFLLAQGKTLKMFNSQGKRVTGFTLTQLPHPLLHPPKHFRMDNKDFIVLQQTNEQLRILSRTGKDRIRLDENIQFSENPFFDYLNTFTSSDRFGNLVQIDTKGNISRKPLKLNPGHRITTTSKSLVTFSENNLNIKGIPVSLPYGNYTPPKIFYINDLILVSITDLQTQKVYLFYSNGTPVGGFPVFGNGVVDISNADDDAALELVVTAGEKEILIYQINF